MSLTLRVDLAAWESHLRAQLAETPGLVPVIKGNGYGFGLTLLAERAQALGVPAIAVGAAPEVTAVREAFLGDLVVLQPWRPDEPDSVALADDQRVIHTVSRVIDLAAIAEFGEARVLVEVLTSMRRHGIAPEKLGDALEPLGRLRFEGWTMHLPLVGSTAVEATRLARSAAAVKVGPIWLSHVPKRSLSRLAEAVGAEVRLRSGTGLWLGEPGSRRVTATVLEVHPVERGEHLGYWRRRVTKPGHVLVLSGGTANGLALAAPSAGRTLRQRVIAASEGILQAFGSALSPYTVAGAKRWFLEPPHMQASMVFLPAPIAPPRVGDEVEVEMRLTTASFDRVELT